MSGGTGKAKVAPGKPEKVAPVLKGREALLDAQARGLLATHGRVAERIELAATTVNSLANRLERHEPGSATGRLARSAVLDLLVIVDDLRAERGE